MNFCALLKGYGKVVALEVLVDLFVDVIIGVYATVAVVILLDNSTEPILKIVGLIHEDYRLARSVVALCYLDDSAVLASFRLVF